MFIPKHYEIKQNRNKMKTLYININNEQVQSTEEFEVLNYDLTDGFLFTLGEKIANGAKVNEQDLVKDFNTENCKDEFQQIMKQWDKLKEKLFSETPHGDFEIILPERYVHWLRYNNKEGYRNIFESRFAGSRPAVVTIDIGEFYEEYISEDLLRKIFRKISDGQINQITFNDKHITRKSMLVRYIKERFDIGFVRWNNEYIPKDIESPDNYKFSPITGNEIVNQLKACQNEECPDFGKYILTPEAKFCPRCGLCLKCADNVNSSCDFECPNISSFLSIEGVVLGKTLISEIPNYIEEKDFPYAMRNDILFKATDKASQINLYFFMVKDFNGCEVPWPKEWEKIRFFRWMSYKDVKAYFSSMIIEVVRSPQLRSYNDELYFDAILKIISHDNSIALMIEFSRHGNNNPASKNTIDSIAVSSNNQFGTLSEPLGTVIKTWEE